MAKVRSALVVGGGIGGMAAAIELRRRGIPVDLIDIDPLWRVYGAGITITSPTLRAFGELGVLPEVLREGFSGAGIRICNVAGEAIAEVPDPPSLGPGAPGSGGIMRPALHRILSDCVRAAGAAIRLGLTIDEIDDDADGVSVRFSDGGRGEYDLLVGADGLFSGVRKLMFPDAPRPEYMGQTVWRLFAPRPSEIDRRHFFLGGEVKVGVCPVSAASLYLFLLENTSPRPIVPDELLHIEMAKLMAGYGGLVGALRNSLTAESPIVVRPLEAFLLPAPWNLGRCVLIGDAAHPTTPQLASGAGMAVEDALVLGDELDKALSVPAALDAFMTRRYPRCRLVVENSIEIGRRERAGAPPEMQTALVEQSLAALAAPI